jgi:biopolymer transport protein ExbD
VKMKRGAGKPLVEAQMISLADIACLLIFFFMMTSTFMRDRVVVSLPDLPQKVSKTESHILVVMDANGVIQLGSDIVADAKDLQTRLQSELAGRTDPNQCEIRFRGDRKLKYKDYAPVYEAISGAGGVISIIHEIRAEGK